MYCRGCQYPLKELDEERCPECGRDFDPADPRTYFVARRWLTRLIRVVAAAAVFFVGMGYFAATIGVLGVLGVVNEGEHALPGAGLIALYGSVPLLLIVIILWKRVTTIERLLFSILAALGLGLWPLISILVRLLGW